MVIDFSQLVGGSRGHFADLVVDQPGVFFDGRLHAFLFPVQVLLERLDQLDFIKRIQ